MELMHTVCYFSFFSFRFPFLFPFFCPCTGVEVFFGGGGRGVGFCVAVEFVERDSAFHINQDVINCLVVSSPLVQIQ